MANPLLPEFPESEAQDLARNLNWRNAYDSTFGESLNNCTTFLLNLTQPDLNLDNNASATTTSFFNCSSNDQFEQIDHQSLLNPGSYWIRLMVLLLYGIVCLVGLCGNTLVIYVVVRFSKMQTVTNLYIVNLAIADECFLVGIPFLMATTALEYWPFGDIMCKIYFTTTSINQVTSSLFLLIMSADRFVAVCHPISGTKLRTPLIASMVAVTAWAMSAFIMVPIYMYANTLEIHGTINCNIFWPNGWVEGDATFMLYSFILGFAIPLILIFVFYSQVILRLRHVGPKRVVTRQRQSLVPQQTTMANDEFLADNIGMRRTNTVLTDSQYKRAKDRKKSHRKVTKLVLTVITVYFFCWAPYWVSQLALISMEGETYHSPALLTIFLLAGCLSYSNSAMNPILYAFLSDNFKKSFVKACSCAHRGDANAGFGVDNSVFPRNRRYGSRSESRRGTCDSGSTRLLNHEKSTTTASTARLLGDNLRSDGGRRKSSNSSYFEEPSKIVQEVVVEEEDVDVEEESDVDNEEVAMLGDGVVNKRERASIVVLQAKEGKGYLLSVVTDVTTENPHQTYLVDGVQMTSL